MELLKKGNYQRFYKVNFNIFVGIRGVKIADIKKDLSERLNKEYRLIDENKDSTDIVCISDAKTHVERLAFAGFEVEHIDTKEKHLIIDLVNISGIMTSMIQGGDFNSVHNDKVYIRHLRMLNRKYNI